MPMILREEAVWFRSHVVRLAVGELEKVNVGFLGAETVAIVVLEEPQRKRPVRLSSWGADRIHACRVLLSLTPCRENLVSPTTRILEAKPQA